MAAASSRIHPLETRSIDVGADGDRGRAAMGNATGDHRSGPPAADWTTLQSFVARITDDNGMTNRQILLTSRPAGEARSADFTLVERPVPELADGQVLVQHLSPYMRGRMNDYRHARARGLIQLSC